MPTTAFLTTKAALPPPSLYSGDSLQETAELGWQLPRVIGDADTATHPLTRSSTFGRKAEIAAPSSQRVRSLEVNADSTPIQIWEGTVIKVGEGIMEVFLDAKMGAIPRHTCEISLEWVSEQDKDLVRPGAVFYLTLFKRTTRGSIQNSQELRFRRRPSWTAGQVREMHKAAEAALANMVPLPTAE